MISQLVLPIEVVQFVFLEMWLKRKLDIWKIEDHPPTAIHIKSLRFWSKHVVWMNKILISFFYFKNCITKHIFSLFLKTFLCEFYQKNSYFFGEKKTGFTVIGHQLGFIESEIPVSTKLDFG